MRRLLLAMIFALAALPVRADDDLVLRGLGSFHVGGRVVEISGKPVREVLLGAGGVPARFDPNGAYQVEQMYVQYFLPQEPQGQAAAA